MRARPLSRRNKVRRLRASLQDAYPCLALFPALKRLSRSPLPGLTLTGSRNADHTQQPLDQIDTKTDANGTTGYSWDYENRLTSVILPGTGGVVTFTYDPFGRRIQKSSAAGTVNYVYDGANPVAEVDALGNAVAAYAQGAGIDEPLAMWRAGVTSYYQADGLGSMTSLANAAGVVSATYTYDAFGNLTNSAGDIVNPFRYTGREWDSETGLYYYRARYYDPQIGRFISEDPIGFDSGMNFYAYVRNSPGNFLDPSGALPPVFELIKADMHRAIQMAENNRCAQFILSLIKKAYEDSNRRAHEHGIGILPETYANQYAAQNLGTFIVTMMKQNYVQGREGPGTGAHVLEPSGSVYIDAGYGGPLDLIHETFHKAPYGFTDMQLADALGAHYKVDPRNSQRTNDNASVAWNCRLREACQ